jgi:hypothetical protein
MLALDKECRETPLTRPKETLEVELASHCREGTWSCELDLAGRQGFEIGARPVSNVVMARGFWFQMLQTPAATLFRFVHCRPPESARFDPGFGDILETMIQRDPFGAR